MARPRRSAPPAFLNGRYELQNVIGSGGMATVHRAFDHRLERRVAIKVLAPALASDPVVRRRFADEANAAGRISHRNVVTIFDTDAACGDPFIVMECLSGVTIATEIARGPLNEARLRSIAADVLAGLQAAHDLGIVHRDIKPSNLLVGPEGSIKIGDFGIAKSLSGVDHTATGDVIGSVAYMAPERLEGAPATNRSDLYSLGVVLYEAAAGRKPFAGDAPAAVAHAVVASCAEPLRAARLQLDAQLTAVIERAMQHDPDDRFASAGEMARALQPTELDRTVLSPAAAPAPESTRVLPASSPERAPEPRVQRRRGSRRRAGWPGDDRRAWALVAAVAVAVLLVLAIVWRPGSAPPNAPAHPGRGATPSTAAAPSTPTSPATAAGSLLQRLDDALQHLEQSVRP